jgi:hypothetical protein
MLYGNKSPRQGIYYQIESNSKVTLEWYVGRTAQLDADKERLSKSIYHFTVAYDSAVPNTFVYTYYAVGNSSSATVGDAGINGGSAAVGLQGGESNLFFFPSLQTTYSEMFSTLKVLANGFFSSFFLQCSPTAKRSRPLTLSARRRSRRACACRAAGRRIGVWRCRGLFLGLDKP